MADIFEIIMNAMFTGFGVAIGTYLANNHFLKKLEKLVKKMRNQK
jgi:hypothetical protein